MLTTTSAGSASSGEPLQSASLSRMARAPSSFGSRPRSCCSARSVAGPQAGDRRQVVGGDGRQRLDGEPRRAVRLEPQQPVGEDAPLVELLADEVLHRAEVLPHDVGPGPVALQGEDVEHLLVAVADVGAVGRAGAERDPEQPEEPHDVVDPDAAGGPQAGPHGADPGVVAVLTQAPGVERRKAPVLPLAVEVVRRGADPHPERHGVLPQPGVGAAGVDAHGQVLHQVEAGAGRGQLRLGQPLQPAVVPDSVGVLGGEAGHRRRVGPAVLLRPVDPGAGEPLGHGAVGGEVAEGLAVLVRGRCRSPDRRPSPEPLPEVLERGSLQLPHPPAVDAAVGVERPALGGQGGQIESVVAGLGGSGDVLDPEVERVPETPARRVVRTRLREVGDGGVQRIEQAHAGAEAARPRRQAAQIGEVADPPRLPGPGGVELRRPPPGAQVGREVAAPGDTISRRSRSSSAWGGGGSRAAGRAEGRRPTRRPGRRRPRCGVPRDRRRWPGPVPGPAGKPRPDRRGATYRAGRARRPRSAPAGAPMARRMAASVSAGTSRH